MANEKNLKKINPFTASLEELEDALKVAQEHHDTCNQRGCNKCASNAQCVVEDCFGVSFSGMSCAGTRALFAALIAQKKQNSETREKQNSEGRKEIQDRPCNGCCENCKWLDSELLKKSGYRFCMHWHNFTISEGFCYAYEGVEKPSETVDN